MTYPSRWIGGLLIWSALLVALAAVHLGLRRYDRRKVDGISLPFAVIQAVSRELRELDDAGRAAHPPRIRFAGPGHTGLGPARSFARQRWPSARAGREPQASLPQSRGAGRQLLASRARGRSGGARASGVEEDRVSAMSAAMLSPRALLSRARFQRACFAAHSPRFGYPWQGPFRRMPASLL